MLPAADSALDLLVLQRVLPRLLLTRHVGTILRFLGLDSFPVHARPELQVLCDTGGVRLRALGLALLETEFGP